MDMNESKLVNDALRERSGSYITTSSLIAFLYELMRDHVTPGTIEQVLRSSMPKPEDPQWSLTNGWLAKYAEDVATRLTCEGVVKAKTWFVVGAKVRILGSNDDVWTIATVNSYQLENGVTKFWAKLEDNNRVVTAGLEDVIPA